MFGIYQDPIERDAEYFYKRWVSHFLEKGYSREEAEQLAHEKVWGPNGYVSRVRGDIERIEMDLMNKMEKAKEEGDWEAYQYYKERLHELWRE